MRGGGGGSVEEVTTPGRERGDTDTGIDIDIDGGGVGSPTLNHSQAQPSSFIGSGKGGVAAMTDLIDLDVAILSDQIDQLCDQIGMTRSDAAVCDDLLSRAKEDRDTATASLQEAIDLRMAVEKHALAIKFPSTQVLTCR
jgi:hypothetical protein